MTIKIGIFGAGKLAQAIREEIASVNSLERAKRRSERFSV
jgi:hypothetical protein